MATGSLRFITVWNIELAQSKQAVPTFCIIVTSVLLSCEMFFLRKVKGRFLQHVFNMAKYVKSPLEICVIFDNDIATIFNISDTNIIKTLSESIFTFEEFETRKTRIWI